MRLQESHARLAIGASAVVFPRSQVMSDHAVTDHQSDVSWHWNQLVLQGAAIEHQCASGGPKTRDELIHDPAERAHVLVFSSLTQLHQFQTREINSRERG